MDESDYLKPRLNAYAAAGQKLLKVSVSHKEVELHFHDGMVIRVEPNISCASPPGHIVVSVYPSAGHSALGTKPTMNNGLEGGLEDSLNANQ
jgi:hypothetical protein